MGREHIPKNSHDFSFLFATAGVRRLRTSDLEWLLDHLWSILKIYSFLCQREQPEKATFGTLDLGGSSLQSGYKKESVCTQCASMTLESRSPLNGVKRWQGRKGRKSCLAYCALAKVAVKLFEWSDLSPGARDGNGARDGRVKTPSSPTIASEQGRTFGTGNWLGGNIQLTDSSPNPATSNVSRGVSSASSRQMQFDNGGLGSI
ncbi:hypothetical protein Ancab_034221 [Ancistrocladus abbreviatus]